MTVLRQVSLGVARQALVTGRVSNALTGEGVTPESLVLEMRLPGTTEFRPLRVGLRFTSGGYFSAAGVAEQVLPQGLPADADLELRFRVSAFAYSDLESVVVVPAPALKVVAEDAALGSHTLPVRLVTAPVLHHLLALQPTPVGISGRVISDHDFNAPLAGISIQVTEPVVLAPVISDAQGRFRIDALPVAEAVTLQVEGSDSTIHHVIDYTTPFNTRIISLNG